MDSIQPQDQEEKQLSLSLGDYKPTNENFVGVIIGKRGMGKTTFADTLTEKFPRVFIYDTRARWGVDVKAGDKAFVVGSLNELMETYYHVLIARKIIYRPELAGDDLETLCELLLNHHEWKDTLFVVDEVGLVCSATHNDIPPALQRLIRFSRHNKIGILFTAQRAVDISRDITAEATFLCSFQNTEPRDIQNLSAHGFPAEELPKLPRYHYLATDFHSQFKGKVSKR